MNQFRTEFYAVIIFGMVLSLAGCATPDPHPSSTTAQTAVTPIAPSPKALNQGMTAEEVIQRIGRPAEIRKIKADIPAEVWIYYRDLGSEYTMIASTTHSIPIQNFATGTMTSTPELDFRPERIDTTQHTELLMINGKLTSYKQFAQKKRSISQ
jgi:hypothetical protein